jgi:hypothetical protein
MDSPWITEKDFGGRAHHRGSTWSPVIALIMALASGRDFPGWRKAGVVKCAGAQAKEAGAHEGSERIGKRCRSGRRGRDGPAPVLGVLTRRLQNTRPIIQHLIGEGGVGGRAGGRVTERGIGTAAGEALLEIRVDHARRSVLLPAPQQVRGI